ncbi:MAG: hypothetical protein HY800_09030 [Ignavibacteriales bacterium]|nr:hypothetical protein [Ignavibacteriales bacterium]
MFTRRSLRDEGGQVSRLLVSSGTTSQQSLSQRARDGSGALGVTIPSVCLGT